MKEKFAPEFEEPEATPNGKVGGQTQRHANWLVRLSKPNRATRGTSCGCLLDIFSSFIMVER